MVIFYVFLMNLQETSFGTKRSFIRIEGRCTWTKTNFYVFKKIEKVFFYEKSLNVLRLLSIFKKYPKFWDISENFFKFYKLKIS